MSDGRTSRVAPKTSRRGFFRRSSLWVMGGSLGLARAVRAWGSEPLRLGLVGCGRRGTTDALHALNTTADGRLRPNGPVLLVAMADPFADQVQKCYRALKSRHPGSVDVPRERQFVALDGYQQLLQCDLDLVILAAPPAFRPVHFEAAARAGKHVFLEKPLATDAIGVRRVLEANWQAMAQGLAVAVGLYRRHDRRYRETVRRLQAGAIGSIPLLRAYWNARSLPASPTPTSHSALARQLRDWRHFGWLSGEHIVEQHVHNLDVINWLKQDYPVECNGMGSSMLGDGDEPGGRAEQRFVEYVYADGSRLFSQCRAMAHCWNSVSEHAHGTRGSANISGGKIYDRAGRMVWNYGNGEGGGERQQFTDLFAALRRGEPLNEADYGAKSTLTAIMGRAATCSGQIVTWEEAYRASERLADVDALRSLDEPPPACPRTPPLREPHLVECVHRNCGVVSKQNDQFQRRSI